MGKTRVLIVDDEEDILDLLDYNLKQDGYKVIRAANGDQALKLVVSEKPELVLLDIMMPKMDGVETCRRMRATKEGKKAFIIFLTARAEEYSEIAGLEAGADDYIAKPIKPRLLLSRIKAVMRRGKGEKEGSSESNITTVGNLKIVKDEYVVYKDGEAISLPKKEFELLDFLASKPGKIFPRELILEKIWGTDVLVVDRTIDVHIRKLRKKVGQDYIETVKGVGYRFVKP